MPPTKGVGGRERVGERGRDRGGRESGRESESARERERDMQMHGFIALGAIYGQTQTSAAQLESGATGGKMPPARGVGKWKGGRVEERE